MNNKNNKKRNKIILLVILVLGLTIGFAALSTTLRINGLTGIKKNTWQVYWANPQVIGGSVTSNIPQITEDSGDPLNTKAVWSTTFTEPGQYYGFTIDATNAGTLDAIIETIQTTTVPATLPDYINFSITYADGLPIIENDILPKANGNIPTTRKYRVMVSYDPTNEQYENIPNDGITIEFDSKPIYKQKPVVTPTPEEKGISVTLKSGNVNLKGKSDSELVEYYGNDITGLSTPSNVEWQLFYSDSDYMYLITKDYVRNSYLPVELEKGGNDTDGDPKYNADFGKCIRTNGYQNISSRIINRETWMNGSSSTVLLENPIINKYAKWVGTYPNVTYESAQAMAYMMDTSVWANFTGNVEGAFAMGGPTIEMFVLSYNSKHESKLSTYETIEDGSNVHASGYQVKKESDSSWSSGVNIDNEISMWNIENKDDVYMYWIASTGGYGNQYSSPYLFNVQRYSDGRGYLGSLYIGQQSINNECYSSTQGSGFRPVVAIPKSSLK